MKRAKSYSDPLQPDVRKWPVYLLSQERDYFIRQLRTAVFISLTANGTRPVRAILEKTLFLERTRLREMPWRVDPPDERAFWTKVRKRLGVGEEDQASRDVEYELLQEVIRRYAQEITGTFQVSTFLFARRFLTLFFSLLLNPLSEQRIWGRKDRLFEKLQTAGPTDTIRSLMDKGTVIIVPTHSSNLDSILIGYALDTVLGLPSFSYGAGLNLYNTGYIAYFMNRLGAYRVDRRKKNLVYLETLKNYSRLTIERGVNSLFFPGGTRSRSGRIESKLKIGLLGTAVEAQRALFEKGSDKKVFVVPLNVSSHFVLEAGTLIDQHLKEEGQERYIMSSREDMASLRKQLRFLWRLIRNGSEITFSFSSPMDVLGNPVCAEGKSYDQHNREIELRDFFRLGESISADAQRESQYSKLLAERIVVGYQRDYVVLSSHFAAFLAFEILRNDHPHMDLYGLVKQPPEDYTFPEDSLRQAGEALLRALKQLAREDKLRLSAIFEEPFSDVFEDGMTQMGCYHAERPLYRDRKGFVKSGSFKLLYFYHNRLDGYPLRDTVKWEKLRVVQEV